MFKKSQLKPWQKRQWCIGQIDGEYLARMEDVLELYERAPQPGQVRLSIDECPCQLLEDVLTPLPMEPGSSKREDYEYAHKGTCTLFMAYDIDNQVRYAQVRQERKKVDYAAFVDEVLREHYPQAERVEVVQDNLNTHVYGSFYEHLPLERAAELRQKIHFHYTPKHGSWLNMVELEFSAFSRQCLKERVASIEQMKEKLQPWVKERNERKVKIHWSFTLRRAREKLQSKYHSVIFKN